MTQGQSSDRVLVFKDHSGQWRWQRLAANNQVVATNGESLHNKGHALDEAHTRNPDCEVTVVDDAG